MGGWGELLTQAIIQWYANKGRNGDTPNQYPVELPPEVKRVFDEAWNVYKAGGTPIQKEIRSIGEQYIGGMPTTAPNFSFVSEPLKNATFAGGVKLPKIDVSKIGPGATDPRVVTPPPPGTVKKVVDEVNPRRERPPVNEDPRAPSPPQLGDRDKPPEGDADFGRFREAWDQYVQDHPNWAKLGVNTAIGILTAATGLGAGVVSEYMRRILLRASGTQPLPPTKPIDTRGPGVKGGGGAVTPPVNREPPQKPKFGDERGAYWNKDYFDRLRSPSAPSKEEYDFGGIGGRPLY